MTARYRAWGALGVLMTAYTVSFIDRTILSLLIPPIQQDLALSDTAVSLLVGMAFAVFYTFLGIPLGRLADRYNRRNLIAAGIFVWCLMTAACGLARSFWQLFLARVGVGVGEAALSPAAYSLISDLFSKEQLGRAIAVYSFGLPIGSGLALLIGGYAIAEIAAMPPLSLPGYGVLAPWQLTFMLVGLPGLLVGLMVLALREPARRDRLVPDPSARRGEPQRGVAMGLLAFIGSSRRLLLCQFGGLSLLVIIVYGCTAWMPTYFIRIHGWTATEIGYAYGMIFLTCGTTGLYTGGWLADRWWRAGRTDAHLRVVLCSLVTMTPCFLLLPLAPTAEFSLALLALATFTSSLHGGVAGAALQLITPNELRGQMTAVYFFIANLVGLGLGPSAVALLTDYGFGDPAALGSSLAVLCLLAGPPGVLLILASLGHYRAAVARVTLLTGPAGDMASDSRDRPGGY